MNHDTKALLLECGAGVQMALGAWGITCAEFLTGLVVNRALGLGVWDYSKQPHNLMGQICLPPNISLKRAQTRWRAACPG